jgi:hypothetical protein
MKLIKILEEINKDLSKGKQNIISADKGRILKGKEFEEYIKEIILSLDIKVISISKEDRKTNDLLKIKHIFQNDETFFIKTNDYPFFEKYNKPVVVEQPFSTQNFPDFLYIDKDYIIPIELKHGKKDNVVWNSNFPKQTAIYITYTSKNKQHEIFMGSLVISKGYSQLLKDF